MKKIPALFTLALACALPASAIASSYYEPTPVEAYIGDAPDTQSPWISTSSGALQGNHLNIHGTSTDSFGNDWWGGAYRADYQLWDWESNGVHNIVGGANLRVNAKILFTNREAADVRVGVHNYGSNVVNGSVRVAGKTLRNWYYSDQSLQEVYQKSTIFFDSSKDFGVGPFSVSFKATASGNVRLEPSVKMENLQATLNVIPSARVNVSGRAGINLLLASASVEGSLSPLVEARMPTRSFLRVRPNQAPCWDAEVDLQLTTAKGTIKIILDYLVNDWTKVIASWNGNTSNYELLDVGQSCTTTVTGFLMPFGL